jgi:hypothetical protein
VTVPGGVGYAGGMALDQMTAVSPPAAVEQRIADTLTTHQDRRGPGDRREEPTPERTHLPRELAPVPRVRSDRTAQGRTRLPVGSLSRGRETA